MDILASNETNKPHFYQKLQDIGFILPSLTSNAVTIESMLRFKEDKYYRPFKNELVPYIKDQRKLNCSPKYAFEMMKNFIRSNMNKEIPFDICPDKDYIFSIVLLCDPQNKLKLLTEVFDIQHVVHQFVRGGQIVDFVEPSEKNSMQELFDDLHNLKLRSKNTVLNYCANLQEQNIQLKEKRKEAQEIIERLDPEAATEMRGRPEFKILFEDSIENELYSRVKNNYEREGAALQIYEQKNYKVFALELLNMHLDVTNSKYSSLFSSANAILSQGDLDEFMKNLHFARNVALVDTQEDVQEQSVRSHGSRAGNIHLEGLGRIDLDDDFEALEIRGEQDRLPDDERVHEEQDSIDEEIASSRQVQTGQINIPQNIIPEPNLEVEQFAPPLEGYIQPQVSQFPQNDASRMEVESPSNMASQQIFNPNQPIQTMEGNNLLTSAMPQYMPPIPENTIGTSKMQMESQQQDVQRVNPEITPQKFEDTTGPTTRVETAQAQQNLGFQESYLLQQQAGNTDDGIARNLFTGEQYKYGNEPLLSQSPLLASGNEMIMESPRASDVQQNPLASTQTLPDPAIVEAAFAKKATAAQGKAHQRSTETLEAEEKKKQNRKKTPQKKPANWRS